MPAPPPPPPPGPPPPPAFDPSKFSSSSAPSADGKNALLQSIRQGTTLKKTQINDRSAPLIDGNRNKSGGGGHSGSSSISSTGTAGNRAAGLNVPPGLSGLFAGGMPKLKPVGGSPGNTGPRTGGWSSSSSNNNNTSSSSINSSNSSPNKPPPPQPPPSNMKPSMNNSQHSNPSETSADDRSGRTPINYGKPSLAPKPPAIGKQSNSSFDSSSNKPAKPNPPPKLYIPPPPVPPPPGHNNNNNSNNNSADSSTPATPPPNVNRAQSMRMPKSASPTTAASVEYRTMGRAAGRGFAGNLAAGQPPPPPRVLHGGAVGRPARPSPLRPPSARPPPPPNKAPPVHPPPPPPMNAPPPPPHRTGPAPVPPQLRLNDAMGPLPPVPQGGPPPPPLRNSSMRSVTSTSSITTVGSSTGSSSSSTYQGVDLEARFLHLFHKLVELPGPAPFSGNPKTYPSKNAQSQSVKRPAPRQPPLGSMVLVNNNSNSVSTC